MGVVQSYRSLTLALFNVKATIRDRTTWYEAYYCSRIVYEFMTHVGEHPNGKKTGRLRIPEFAKQRSDTLRGFIAGLFSVEGSVTFASNVRLQIQMLEPILIQELYLVLSSSGSDPKSIIIRRMVRQCMDCVSTVQPIARLSF